MMKEEIELQHYQDLAYAIVLQATRDYLDVLHGHMVQWKKPRQAYVELMQFYNGEWFKVLCDFDSNEFLKNVKITDFESDISKINDWINSPATESKSVLFKMAKHGGDTKSYTIEIPTYLFDLFGVLLQVYGKVLEKRKEELQNYEEAIKGKGKQWQEHLKRQ